MLGAIIGDLVGSKYEFDNIKTKEFEFLTYRNFVTDDTIMTLAVAKALLNSKNDYSDLEDQTIKYLRELGRDYPDASYGVKFREWLYLDEPKPYNSYGNGAPMRVSGCGIIAKTLEEAKMLSKKVTKVTHNHPEGLKGAEAVAVAIFLAKSGYNMLEIRDHINENYYKMNFKLKDIRESYEFNESSQETVPQAIEAFLESKSFEDAIRNAISIGGDSDTLAAITGSIASAYYGVPLEIRKHAITFLDEKLLRILIEFENKYSPSVEKQTESGVININVKNEKIQTGGRAKMIEKIINKANSDLEDINGTEEETSSQKLFNHLFESCNILRGPINQDEYKSYVTPLLFFKRISDVYDEETEAALEKSGGDLEFASFAENHSFVIPEGCHWSDVRNTSENVGTAIVNAMSGIERANPENLSGVFSSFDDASWTDKTKLTDERLKDLIEHMSSIKVGNNNYSSDVMGDAYEYLIKKFADLSKANAGEFYTPRSIVRLLVKLVDPKDGEDVYDPACGTGGMLIEAMRHIKDKRYIYGHFFGQEKNLATSAIARMNLFLHGARDFKILQGDTLLSPKFIKNGQIQKFDCVIANPPFSLNKWGSDFFETDPYGRNIWGTPGDSIADFAWIQHMVQSTNKNGRVAVILPQGVLFRGNREADMREKLVKSDLIESIITLVPGVFYSTGISACVLLLNKNKSNSHKGKVAFIDGSKIYTPQRAQNIMTDHNVDEIYTLYKNYENVKEKCSIATIEEIESNKFILKPNLYIERKEIERIDPNEVKLQYMESVQNVLETENALKSILEKGGYLDD